MSVFILAMAMIPTVLFCWFRIKQYNLSVLKMLFVISFFFVSGTIGAVMVQYLINGSLTGKRLYGLMLADAIMLPAVSKILKRSIADIGDFISVPVMAICCTTKIDCIRHGCCYGIKLFQLEMQPTIRFPSQVVELLIWAALTVVLILLERKHRMRGKMWPFSMVWFGILRFVADFFRGSALEKETYALWMPAGQFWSLIVFGMGLTFMCSAIKKEIGRGPTIEQIFKIIIGIEPEIEQLPAS